MLPFDIKVAICYQVRISKLNSNYVNLMVFEIRYESNHQKIEILLFIFYFSENETDTDQVLEMSSKPAETIFGEHAVSKDEDNETEISQYLTLTQLGNILRELSVLGKTLTYIHVKQLKPLLRWMKNVQLWYQNYLYLLNHERDINFTFQELERQLALFQRS